MKICYESFQMLHNKLAELLGKNFRCCCFWELMTYSIVLMAQVQSINFILIYHHRNYWLRQKAIQEKSFFWQNPIWGKICHHLRNLDYCIFTTREIDFILVMGQTVFDVRSFEGKNCSSPTMLQKISKYEVKV